MQSKVQSTVQSRVQVLQLLRKNLSNGCKAGSPQVTPGARGPYGVFSVSKFERSYTILMRSVRNFMRSVSYLMRSSHYFMRSVSYLMGSVSYFMVADRGIPKRAPEARYPNLVGRYPNPVGPLPNHVAKVQRFIGKPT